MDQLTFDLPVEARYSCMLPLHNGYYVYRCWDALDRCIYVGRSKHVLRRLGSHALLSWYEGVHHVDVAAFMTMPQADAEEIMQIRLWQPVNNSQHNRTWERRNSKPKPTSCPQGHPYDDANTLYNSSGSKVCRTCKNDRAREKAVLKGRPTGERNPASKLSANAAADIRRQRARGVSVSSLSRSYDVTRATIRSITEGRTWIHALREPAKTDSLEVANERDIPA